MEAKKIFAELVVKGEVMIEVTADDIHRLYSYTGTDKC
jgi:hypothetical protein